MIIADESFDECLELFVSSIRTMVEKEKPAAYITTVLLAYPEREAIEFNTSVPQDPGSVPDDLYEFAFAFGRHLAASEGKSVPSAAFLATEVEWEDGTPALVISGMTADGRLNAARFPTRRIGLLRKRLALGDPLLVRAAENPIYNGRILAGELFRGFRDTEREKRGEEALPRAHEIYLKYADRHYDENDRKRKLDMPLLPDRMSVDPLVTRVRDLCLLDDEKSAKVLAMMTTDLPAATREDWAESIGVTGNVSPDWIDAVDRHFTRTRIRKLLERSDPADFSNEYLVVCCQLTAILGRVLTQASPRLVWVPEWPYWETFLFDEKLGERTNLFYWAIRKLSEDGVDVPLAEKCRVTLRRMEAHERK